MGINTKRITTRILYVSILIIRASTVNETRKAINALRPVYYRQDVKDYISNHSGCERSNRCRSYSSHVFYALRKEDPSRPILHAAFHNIYNRKSSNSRTRSSPSTTESYYSTRLPCRFTRRPQTQR